jgi:hypothetical protein
LNFKNQDILKLGHFIKKCGNEDDAEAASFSPKRGEVGVKKEKTMKTGKWKK